MTRSRFLLVVVLLWVCSGVMPRAQTGPGPLLDPEQEVVLKALYDDPERFEQLSGAYRTVLERRFGKRPPDAASGPVPSPRPAWPVSNLAVANPLVNDPAADTTPQDTQSGTALVLGSGSAIIAAYNDSGSFGGGSNRFTGVSRSANSGASWTDGGGLPGNNDAGYPVLARDAASGRTYLSTLEFNTGSAIQVFRSDDNGTTWSPPVNAAPGRAALDKEWIAVDNFPGLGQGNVYVVFRDFSAGNGIFFTRSTDGGATFGPNGGILVASAGSGNVQGGFVTVGPDHTVYFFYYSQATTPRSIRMTRSLDRGLTFSAPITIASLVGTGTNGDLALNGGFRSNSFPQAAVNPVNGHLYAVYNDVTGGTDHGNILLRVSTDSGSTWSAALLLNDDASGRDQFFPTIAVTPDGSHLFVSWYDRRADPANLLIERFATIATISGANVPVFGPNFGVSEVSFPPVRGQDPVVNAVFMGDYDQAAADNGFFYTTWGDNRLGNAFHPHQPDVRFARIPVGGVGGVLGVVDSSPAAFDGTNTNAVTFTLRNRGTSTVTGISAALTSSTPGINILQGAANYPDLGPGMSSANATPFTVFFNCNPLCPAAAELTLTVTTASDGVFTFASSVPLILRARVNDLAIAEGNAGFRSASFTVSLSGPAASEARVTATTADGTATAGPPGPAVTFTSSNAVAIPATGTAGAAAPYPATVVVTGTTAPIGRVAVRINGLTHTFPSDLDLLLVGPGGQRALFMSDIGGGTPVVNVDLTFQDGAPAPPAALITGTYAPTDLQPGDILPAPAPAGPYTTALSVFNGTNPNGTWSLYVLDDAAGDVGSIASFSLLISPATGDYAGVAREIVFPPGSSSQTVDVVIIGDTAVESNETLTVTLSAPMNMVITQAQATGTILNDDGATLPTAAPDSYSVIQNGALTVTMPGVLANDNPNGGGTLRMVVVTGPAHGTLNVIMDFGTFTYLPAPGYSGPDSFTYQAYNALGASNPAVVSIAVIPIPPPTTVNDTFATPFNGVLNVSAPGVLANDNANGGGAVTAGLVTTTSHGTLTLAANGGFSYTPAANFAGIDTFTYRAVSAFGAGNPATATITVAAPTTVQAPFNLRVDAVVGNQVTLRWDTLPVGPQASTFILEGGRSPGEVLASISTNSASPIFSIAAPTGSWSIRVYGQRGSDRSPASNEVPLFVNVPIPPSSPAALLGLANGTRLDLVWKNTFGGGASTDVVLDVTGSFVGSFPIGNTDRFTFAPVPGGTYTFSVHGTNAGGQGPASAPVTLTFPGTCGPPATPANFLGYAVGSTVSVIWDPPVTGPAPTGYIVEVTGSFTGQVPTAGRALSGTVGPGTYNLRVQAVNACGTSAFTAPQSVAVP